MRAKQRKIITAAAKTAAVVVLIGCALILPIGSLTAGAYVYVDNTAGNTLAVGSNTLIEDIVINAEGSTGICSYVGARANVGYASQILNTSYYLSVKPFNEATRFAIINIIGNLNNVTIQVGVIDFINPAPGIVWEHTWGITPSTTAIRYTLIWRAGTTGFSITATVNGSSAITTSALTDIVLDTSPTHKYYMSYIDSDAISSARYNGQSQYDWSIGYVSDVIFQSSRAIASAGSYQSGYDAGLALGQSQSEEVSAWTIFENIWTGLDVIMSVEILPNFKLWYLVGLPLATSLILWIVGLFRG